MADKEKQKEEQVEEPAEEASEVAEQAPESEEADELKALRAGLNELEAKAAENLDGWQRAQAEFANYKKRVTRDQAQLYEETKGRFAKRYLEILDDFERALGELPKEGEGAKWAEGIELVYRKFSAYLESEGIRRMEITDMTFDPNRHEAIAQEESENHKSGEIIEIVQPGYMLGERVLRPAIVKVAK